MNLNSILGPLEKLITEHGSAVIQERHISLLKSELTVYEKRISEFEAKVAILEAENTDIKAKLKNSQTENKELRAKVKEYEDIAQNPHERKAETNFDPFHY
jgi:predicted RNase H-like nuclease (RuvC/YqgF family)